jgi:hypothetical protein
MAAYNWKVASEKFGGLDYGSGTTFKRDYLTAWTLPLASYLVR